METDIDIQQKLDLIEANNQELLNQTPAQLNSKEVTKYYQQVLQARTVKDQAPEDLKEAEERYYKARYGDKYMDVLQKKYETESKEVLKTMMDVHQDQLTTLNDKIETHRATATYFKNIDEVQQTWLEKTKKWVDGINKANASLNNRNTFYADEEQGQLSYWILFENCILLSFIVVTIVLTVMGKKEDLQMKIIGCTALACIVFFTNTFLTWLRYLPKSVTFYTQWGYDPMESKVPWLLMLIFVLFGAICVVYIQAITQFLENMTDRWNGRPPRHVDTRYGNTIDPNYPRYGRTDPRYRDTRYGTNTQYPYGVNTRSPYGANTRSPYGANTRSPYGANTRSPYGANTRSPYGANQSYGADPWYGPTRSGPVTRFAPTRAELLSELSAREARRRRS